MRRRINAVGCSAPLQPIACRLGKSRIAAGDICVIDAVVIGIRHLVVGTRALHSSSHVAHAATNLYGIGCNHAPTARAVAQHHHVIVDAFAQHISSHIHPCAASHLLIHLHLGGSRHAVDGVQGFVDTLGQCLIRHIHRIFALLGNVGTPACLRLATRVIGSSCLPVCAFGKRILVCHILLTGVSKSRLRAFLPTFALLGVTSLRQATIGVNYHLHPACVALSRTHNVCSGIPEHRHKKRQHIRLGVEVLHRLPNAGTLPFPTI